MFFSVQECLLLTLNLMGQERNWGKSECNTIKSRKEGLQRAVLAIEQAPFIVQYALMILSVVFDWLSFLHHLSSANQTYAHCSWLSESASNQPCQG